MGTAFGLAIAWGSAVGMFSVSAGIWRSTAGGDLRLHYLMVASAFALPLGAVLGAASLWLARYIWHWSRRVRPSALGVGVAAAGPILLGAITSLSLASTVLPGLLAVVWVPIAGSCLGGAGVGAWLAWSSQGVEQ